MKRFLNLTCTMLMLFAASSCIQAVKKQEIADFQITRHDREGSAILKGVTVPAGRTYYYSSGMVAPVANESAEGTAKYGSDTYMQSLKAMARIEEALKEQELSMKDVITLKVYIAPDPANGKRDFEGWFKAYGEFFNNSENPNKVARTTLGVAELARPGILVEVEVVAVYPE